MNGNNQNAFNLVLVRLFVSNFWNAVKLSWKHRNAVGNAKLDGPFSCNRSHIAYPLPLFSNFALTLLLHRLQPPPPLLFFLSCFFGMDDCVMEWIIHWYFSRIIHKNLFSTKLTFLFKNYSLDVKHNGEIV